jgi:hypothetical protein
MKMEKGFLQKLDQTGLNLLELTITLAIASIMVLSFTSLSGFTFATMSSIDKSVAVASTMQDLRLTLSSSYPVVPAGSTVPVNECTANLRNTPLGMNQPAGVPLTQTLGSHGTTGNLAQSIATVGDTQDGISISSIMLVPLAQVDTNMIVANLQFAFQKSNVMGSASAMRTIPIFAKVESGVVQTCWQRQESATIIGTPICAATSAVGANLYDPLQDLCIAPKMAWFTGTSASASCPSGDSLPAGTSSAVNCGADAPSGWTDPSTPTPISMSDGSVVQATRNWVIYTQNLVTNTCNCYYAADLPAGTASTMVCKIRCIVP